MKELKMELIEELKVPHGGFRGGFPSKLEGGNKESGGSVEI